MQAYDLYQDIAQRTQGDVYVGVVGPVRTGKSTFIRRLMEKMIIPAIDTVSLLKPRLMCYNISGDENEEIRDNH